MEENKKKLINKIKTNARKSKSKSTFRLFNENKIEWNCIHVLLI